MSVEFSCRVLQKKPSTIQYTNSNIINKKNKPSHVFLQIAISRSYQSAIGKTDAGGLIVCFVHVARSFVLADGGSDSGSFAWGWGFGRFVIGVGAEVGFLLVLSSFTA